VARRFALENFMAFVPDALTTDRWLSERRLSRRPAVQPIDRDKMTQDFVASARWLKARPDCTGVIAATGFCFGGGMSNTLAVLPGAELAAAAPFYGGAPPVEDVPRIKAAMLINHGGLDTRLVEARRDASLSLATRVPGYAPAL